MSTKVFVTHAQVQAATAELAAMRSAGREYDPLLEKLAAAKTVRHERPSGQNAEPSAEMRAERPVGTSAEVTRYKASTADNQTETVVAVAHAPVDFEEPPTVVGTERDGDELLRVNQAAEYLGLSTNQLYKLMASNVLPHYKVGKHVFFSREALAAQRRADMEREKAETDAGLEFG